jgi:HPt (histidine-containing phosphotransfer) domain-containing protein
MEEYKKAEQRIAREKNIPESTVESKDTFIIEDLDIEKGLLYCGNKKNYLEILASQRDSGRETLQQVQHTYESENWKDYVILVHGIKSAMMSIGAVNLSEMAKGLEFAGKGEDFDYIHKRHIPMVQEYERIMQILDECKYLAPRIVQEVNVQKPEIELQVFEEKLVELENATYEFDGSKVTPILDALSAYAYKGKDLANELKPVYKKVEMFDFMSAYEAVVKLKEFM